MCQPWQNTQVPPQITNTVAKGPGPIHTSQQGSRDFKGDAFPPAGHLAFTQVMAMIETSFSEEDRIWHFLEVTGTPLLCLPPVSSAQRTLVAWDTPHPAIRKMQDVTSTSI